MSTSLEQRLYRSKGGSSLYIEKAVCTTLHFARNHPTAIAGKVLYQAGALDLLTKAVMNVSLMLGANSVCTPCFFSSTFSQLTSVNEGSPAGAEGSPGPQTFLASNGGR